MGKWDTLVLPEPERAAAYRAAGWWRETTFLDDLSAAARDRGDHPAVIAYEDSAPARELSYADLQLYVERFAAALSELGVGRGDVVALYLPNRWELTALYLACYRMGAVATPVIPALDVRELGHVLRESEARVCVTVDRFQDIDYGARLQEAAPQTLAHRVVCGDAEATGALGFDAFFVRTPWEERSSVDEADRLGPDDPALLLYTSGTTGRMKGVVHSQNTLHAAVLAVSVPHRLTGDDVISIPNFATHMAGLSYACFMPLLLGATCVVQDTNRDMELLLDLIARHGITWAYASPAYLLDMLDAQGKEPRDTSSVVQIVSGSAPIQPQLIARMREVFDIPVRALWGMTENGAVTVTRDDDPEGWAGHSDGRAEPSMEVRIAPETGAEEAGGPAGTGGDTDAGGGRLLVRGASQCLGYLGQRDVYEACLDEDGWFDTSDLARDDGRGGIRIVGRSVDQVTRASGQKVSTLEVESVLIRHPGVREVALVGYPDPRVPVAELVCAVVVAEGEPPTLEELRRHLAEERMAEVLWPDRVQFVWELPKNSLGKVLRHPLRQRLQIEYATHR
ncbi:AMP-binding protein [Streptomyces sp. N2-109]|uniref:AMP-binding protein n=1 Tax=Streptomyces gossypii TaxID=2883101 RepID=A0ABT2JQI7_9ACTN|nr:AMP-binding protein [Streptomyces gossypii]MCT2589968.1 AMP-binding protein [Streptomyces gossypii]